MSLGEWQRLLEGAGLMDGEVFGDRACRLCYVRSMQTSDDEVGQVVVVGQVAVGRRRWGGEGGVEARTLILPRAGRLPDCTRLNSKPPLCPHS